MEATTRASGDLPSSMRLGQFPQHNRAKRSITLDIKAAADVDALKRLVRDADILIQNLRPVSSTISASALTRCWRSILG